MNQQLILQPVASLFLLTGIVWAFMYARRLPFILGNNIDPQSIATPELLNAQLPANINNPSNNLKNLFELPVIFYALCAFLLLSQKVDDVFLYSAWAYVGLRAIHSLIHCTVNIVNLGSRRTSFLVSSCGSWRLGWRALYSNNALNAAHSVRWTRKSYAFARPLA